MIVVVISLIILASFVALFGWFDMNRQIKKMVDDLDL